MIEQIPVSCSKDCSGGCTLLAHVEDGVLKRITSNPAVGGGTLLSQSGCVNGFQMPHIVYHPQRITRPLMRIGERGSGVFRPVSWDEALDFVANNLRRIKETWGPKSVLNLMGTGSVSGTLHNTYALPQRFFSLFGGCTRFHSSYSSGASSFAMRYVFGVRDRSGFDPANLPQSRLIILWGANVMDTHLGSETGPRLMQARRQGIPVIAVEPRITRTIRRLDAEWIPCRPGTDTALMQAVLFVLLEEKLVDWDFIHRYSTGFDLLAGHVLGREDGLRRDPFWAEKICGTPAAVIADFARRYGTTRPAVLMPGYSIQRTIGGEESFRMAVALQTALGNTGKPGGSSGDLANRLPKPRFGSLPIPPADCPSVPVLRWPDAVLEGRAGGYPADIKAIYSTGGNYLNQGSDIFKNIRAFQAVDLVVCHDYFLTPTARFCDVLLPVTTYLERNDIVCPDSGNYLTFSNRAIPPVGEARDDYQIFCAMADRLGFGDAFSEKKTEEDWLRSFVADSDIPDFEEFKRSGVYAAADQQRVGLSDFTTDPSAHPLPTPSGKIEISSETYHHETSFPSFPVYRGPQISEDFPLLLMTPKSRYRIHSQGSNVNWLREREQHALWMNPADALSGGIHDGDQVLLGNRQGSTRVKVHVTADIMPGVVSLLEGVWLDLADNGVDMAGSANMVTSTEGTRPSRASTTNSVPVWVKRLGGI